MKQLLTMLAAAIFAAVSVSAVAQPKEEKKKSTEMKAEKSATGAKAASDGKPKAKRKATKGKKKAEGEAAMKTKPEEKKK